MNGNRPLLASLYSQYIRRLALAGAGLGVLLGVIYPALLATIGLFTDGFNGFLIVMCYGAAIGGGSGLAVGGVTGALLGIVLAAATQVFFKTPKFTRQYWLTMSIFAALLELVFANIGFAVLGLSDSSLTFQAPFIIASLAAGWAAYRAARYMAYAWESISPPDAEKRTGVMQLFRE